MSGDQLTIDLAFTIFVLAILCGFAVISKVPATLHTPLMSGANSIHGIVLVGAMIIATTANDPVGGSTSSQTAVAAMDSAMPPADSRLPSRAVAGEFMRTRPSTNDTAPASQNRRTIWSMTLGSRFTVSPPPCRPWAPRAWA